MPLNLRRRRELGLTFGEVLSIAKQLKSEGEIDKDTDHGVVAAAIAARIAANKSDQFDGEGLDLDSIIAFIEKLLPLILKLIDLFS